MSNINVDLDKYKLDCIIGQSLPIMKVMQLIDRVASSCANVLITGESGTGKELVAQALHYNSERSKEPLIAINCTAIPSELLESELFGHVKGAFTGATSDRVGRFEKAKRGTIFLDEIGDMSPSLQAKLLRVLQDRKFEPVGDSRPRQFNARVITATNIDLERAIKENRFRRDLYYRLNVIPIKMPSLRERPSDIPILTHYFLKIFTRQNHKQINGISKSAMDQLCAYPWPGNIRELENLIERLVIIKDHGLIELADIPAKYITNQKVNPDDKLLTYVPNSGIDLNEAIARYENMLLVDALNKVNWNKNRAASLLKLNRTTLVEKIKRKKLKQV